MNAAFAPVTTSDWPAAQRLLAETPMSAALPLAVERVGNLETAFAALSGKSLAYVARQDGYVAGFVHGNVAVRRRHGASPAPLLYFGDLRVAKIARRTGIALGLLDALAREAQLQGCTGGYCLVNEGNRAMLELLASGRSRIAGEPVRTLTTASRVAVRQRSASQDVLVAGPVLRPVCMMVADQLAARPFAPVVTEEAVAAFFARHPEACVIAPREQPLRPLCILWDQHALRRLHLTGQSLVVRAARAALGRQPSARVAEIGFTLDAAGVGTGLTELLAIAADEGAHVVNVVESGPDPSQAPLRVPWAFQRTRTHVVPFGIAGHTAPVLPASSPCFFDLTLL